MTELHVTGMTCGNCAQKVTTALRAVPGVAAVLTNVEVRRVSVRWSGEANLPAALAALHRAGYDATPLEPSAATTPTHNWHLNLWLGAVVTLALIGGEWIFGLAMTPWFRWLAFALAAVVQIFCGAEFFRGAWRQLKSGGSNMDTLVALGSTTAFGFSCWVLFRGHGGHVYFMEAAAIITLISFGHWLEARVGEKASGALKSLMQLTPQTARRIRNSEFGVRNSTRGFDLRTISFSKSAIRNPQSEIEIDVPISELKNGDLVALRPGDRVPVDGVVVEGESAVDEAMLTGESALVDKKIGGELFAGTVNLNGRLVMRVTATGEATALAHVIAAVQRAQSSRADIQRLGDRVSSVFVPVVVAIALAAGIFWAFHFGAEKAFVVAAGVLIVSCPCAMGLATPAAIMVSANAAARRGILIRDGVALEKAGKITAVIFDKTGTLTAGKPEVAAVENCGMRNAECGMEKLAAALARNSTHPISQAIAKISAEKLQIENWKEIRGCGVEAKSAIGNRQSAIRLGSLRWLREGGADLAAGEKFVAEWANQGATLVGLAIENELTALFAVRDEVKPNAANVVAQLQRRGLKTFLVTGDNALTATSIAKQVGIAAEKVFAEVKPEQKAEFVQKLQARGERVAFVGDGINDAPALTQADLGVAVSRASDVAREAADIILLKSEIEAVPEALGLAQATLRTIRQNLFWAFFYNAVGVPLAAAGFVSPILCAAAMGASDLIVIGNALRLARWKNSTQ